MSKIADFVKNTNKPNLQPSLDVTPSNKISSDYEVDLEDFGYDTNLLTKRKIKYDEVAALSDDEDDISGYSLKPRDQEASDLAFKQLVKADSSLEQYYNQEAIKKNKAYKSVIKHSPELTVQSKRDAECYIIKSEERSIGARRENGTFFSAD